MSRRWGRGEARAQRESLGSGSQEGRYWGRTRPRPAPGRGALPTGGPLTSQQVACSKIQGIVCPAPGARTRAVTPSALEGVARSQQSLGRWLAEDSPDTPQGWSPGPASGLRSLPLRVLVQECRRHRVGVAWIGLTGAVVLGCLEPRRTDRQTLLQELSVGGSLPPLETSLWGEDPFFGRGKAGSSSPKYHRALDVRSAPSAVFSQY